MHTGVVIKILYDCFYICIIAAFAACTVFFFSSSNLGIRWIQSFQLHNVRFSPVNRYSMSQLVIGSTHPAKLSQGPIQDLAHFKTLTPPMDF